MKNIVCLTVLVSAVATASSLFAESRDSSRSRSRYSRWSRGMRWQSRWRRSRTAPESFAKLDKSKDGKLNADELPSSLRKNFGKVDTNRDGYVDRDEYRKATGSSNQRSQDFIDRYAEGLASLFLRGDRNRDGKLNREEISSRLRPSFSKYDRDNDGYVTRDELTAGLKVALASRYKARSADREQPAKSKDIVDTAVGAGSFKTLVTAVKAADLVKTLKGKGPFTVFAPSDSAFAKLPKWAIASLLKKENKSGLQGVLTYHVVSGKVLAKDVVKLKSAKTVNGKTVKIEVREWKGVRRRGAGREDRHQVQQWRDSRDRQGHSTLLTGGHALCVHERRGPHALGVPLFDTF